jgi:hypothetical protein
MIVKINPEIIAKIKELAEGYHQEIILWRDSYAPHGHSTWHCITSDPQEKMDDYIVLTLGTLIEEDDTYIKVAQNYGHGEAMNEIVIPVSSILDGGRIPFNADTLTFFSTLLESTQNSICLNTGKDGDTQRGVTAKQVSDTVKYLNRPGGPGCRKTYKKVS